MTRKNITTAEITAGRTDAEHLLSLTSADAADAERAVPPFRLTQLVMARFDMDVVEAAVFLNFCGAAPTPTPQNADAEFHAHLRRVIDRYRLDCLFVEDAPGLSRGKGSRLAAAGTLHLASDRGASCAARKWRPFGLGSSDFLISGLVRLSIHP